MSAAPAWLRSDGSAVTIEVVVQPRASRSRVVGEHGGRLKVQLAAPPVDGEANAELVDLLADVLEVRKAEIAIVQGDTGRRKTIRVQGLTLDRAAAALRAT